MVSGDAPEFVVVCLFSTYLWSLKNAWLAIVKAGPGQRIYLSDEILDSPTETPYNQNPTTTKTLPQASKKEG